MKVDQLLESGERDPMDDVQVQMWTKVVRSQNRELAYKMANVTPERLKPKQQEAVMRTAASIRDGFKRGGNFKPGTRVCWIGPSHAGTTSVRGAGTILYRVPKLDDDDIWQQYVMELDGDYTNDGELRPKLTFTSAPCLVTLHSITRLIKNFNEDSE